MSSYSSSKTNHTINEPAYSTDLMTTLEGSKNYSSSSNNNHSSSNLAANEEQTISPFVPILLPPTSPIHPSTSHDSNQADKNKNVKRRRKKPKDKPKRPLSAYNIFFKEERLRILNGSNYNSGENSKKAKSTSGTPTTEMDLSIMDNFLHSLCEDENNSSSQEISNPQMKEDESSGNTGLCPLLLPDILQETKEPSSEGTSDAAARAPHGKISFENLAKVIGTRWKNLNINRLKYYRNLADVDAERYRVEMEEYNDRIVSWRKNRSANSFLLGTNSIKIHEKKGEEDDPMRFVFEAPSTKQEEEEEGNRKKRRLLAASYDELESSNVQPVKDGTEAVVEEGKNYEHSNDVNSSVTGTNPLSYGSFNAGYYGMSQQHHHHPYHYPYFYPYNHPGAHGMMTPAYPFPVTTSSGFRAMMTPKCMYNSTPWGTTSSSYPQPVPVEQQKYTMFDENGENIDFHVEFVPMPVPQPQHGPLMDGYVPQQCADWSPFK